MEEKHFWIDGQKVSYQLDGELETGEDKVLLESDVDLCGEAWAKAGYSIYPFISSIENLTLLLGIKRLICEQIKAICPEKDLSFFQLDQYHRYVNDAQHAELIRHFRKCFPVEKLPIPLTRIEDRVGEACGQRLSVTNPRDGSREFCLRIVRPQAPSDNNPPHRDVYLDHLRDGINIYVPLAGSNALSSLPLLPESHRLSESVIERTARSAKVNGVQYTVPCITAVQGDLRLTRPNPGPNEMLVFSPYLVHGGGANLNADVTRISLEMRFWGLGHLEVP